MTEAGTDWLEIRKGNIPFIVSFPHTGTTIPSEYAGDFVSATLALRDTDWHLDKVFRPLLPAGTTVVRTDISRSVIDVNRPPDGQSLYPGQATTELCPTTDFDGTPLHRPGKTPGDGEIERRRTRYHAPYAAALRAQIERLHETHGWVAILDCHSIRPRVPRLFEGTLPTLNIGTNGGASCRPELQARLEDVARRSPFSWISNGRFKGGWITRHFGDPGQGVQSVQIEISMNAYLTLPQETHYGAPDYMQASASLLQHVLHEFIEELV